MSRLNDPSARRVAVTGATGLVGSALVAHLTNAGHRVSRLVRNRRQQRESDIYWNPASRQLDAADLEGFDAFVHLAGESIAQRWTDASRARISESRIEGTRLLARGLAGLERPPKVLVCASAIGFYGDRGSELVDERSARGDGFLAELVDAWEAASIPVRDRGIRLAHARFGVLLSPAGGALQRLLLPFRMGIGGPVGSGEQWMSWIALHDCVRAIDHLLFTDSVDGVTNLVSPEPATNAEFSQTLARVLHRPAVFRVPAFALRTVFAEMADETLLASQRVEPSRLRASGFEWRYPTLEGALRFELGR